MWSWAHFDVEEYMDAETKLVAYCGRYGGWAPDRAIAADIHFLNRYAKAVEALMKEEMKPRK